MNHPDIITLICSLIDDIDKFSFLSITKEYDIVKGKMWFHERVHLYRIYGHPQCNRFTNVIICSKIKKCINPDGKLVGSKKIILPSNTKKVEFLSNIKCSLPDGVTHLKPHYTNWDNIPQSVTHLNLYSGYGTDHRKLILPKGLQCLESNGGIFNELPKSLTHLIHNSDNGIPSLPNLEYLSTHYSSDYSDNVKFFTCFDITFDELHINLKKLYLNFYCSDNGSISHLINLEILEIYITTGPVNEWPPNIKQLTIHQGNDNNVKDLTLSLTKLSLGCHVNDIWNLPNLTHLDVKNFIRDFTKDHLPKLYYFKDSTHLYKEFIPSTVRHLSLGHLKCERFTKNSIPQFITHLTFSDDFNLTIKKRIPLSVTHLSFGEKFCKKNLSKDIPQTVTHLTLSSKCYTLNKHTLRDRELSIKIVHNYVKDPFVFDDFE